MPKSTHGKGRPRPQRVLGVLSIWLTHAGVLPSGSAYPSLLTTHEFLPETHVPPSQDSGSPSPDRPRFDRLKLLLVPPTQPISVLFPRVVPSTAPVSLMSRSRTSSTYTSEIRDTDPSTTSQKPSPCTCSTLGKSF